MATYNKHQIFLEDCFEKVHNLASDTLKVVLCNTAPVATNSILANLTQISNGNGYTTGGATTAQSSSAHTTGTYKLVIGDVSWTASGGTIGPFRYADLYNDTPTSPADPLIAWWDYGSSITLAIGETFTTDFDATNGVLQAT